MLDGDGVRVKVLQRQVREEADLVVLVERDVDVVLAGALLLRRHFVGDCHVGLLDLEFVFLGSITQSDIQVHHSFFSLFQL